MTNQELHEILRGYGFGSVEEAVVELKGLAFGDWRGGEFGMAGPFPVALTELFRAGKLKHPDEAEEYGRSEWRELKHSIEESGIESALWLAVDFEKRRAYLAEGKHRSVVADELGLNEVPVVVMRGDVPPRRGAKIPKEIGLHDPGGQWMSPRAVFPGLLPARLLSLPTEVMLALLDQIDVGFAEEDVEYIRQKLSGQV
jgi:hypothetical protein